MTSILFNQFALLLGLTAVIGFISFKLKQPLILAFILVGIIAGSSGLGMITASSQMELLGNFGITLLLFIVGLKLDMDLIKAYGSVVFWLGIGQMVLTAFFGFWLALILGIDWFEALFVASALAFSSTIIIIKSLSDKNELDSLYGRIAVGILIIQDLVVVLAIIFLSSMNAAATNSMFVDAANLFLKGIGFLVAVIIAGRSLLPFLFEQAAESRELLVLFALAFAAILAVCAEVLGFGKEIGGFIAGVALASSQYRETIAARLDTVRNLLLVFFFINLGASVEFANLSAEILPVIVLSIFVLLIKPLIVMVLMGYARFKKRTSFMTAVTMGQVSEFSLILTALAHQLGYIDTSVVGLIIFISLISIGLSTYMLTGASELYNRLSGVFDIFERSKHHREDINVKPNDDKVDVIVYGYGRHGEFISAILEAKKLSVMGVDFDPRKVKARHHHRVPLRYGDAEDTEFIRTLPLDQAQWVVSTVPNYESNRILVASLREIGFKGKIALSAYLETDLEPLNKLKVDLILIPYRDAAMSAAEQIAELSVR